MHSGGCKGSDGARAERKSFDPGLLVCRRLFGADRRLRWSWEHLPWLDRGPNLGRQPWIKRHRGRTNATGRRMSRPGQMPFVIGAPRALSTSALGEAAERDGCGAGDSRIGLYTDRGPMPSIPRLLFTGWFIAMALWCAFTIARPNSRLSGVTRVAGGRVVSQRQRRVIAGLVGVLSLCLAVTGWNTVK